MIVRKPKNYSGKTLRQVVESTRTNQTIPERSSRFQVRQVPNKGSQDAVGCRAGRQVRATGVAIATKEPVGAQQTVAESGSGQGAHERELASVLVASKGQAQADRFETKADHKKGQCQGL